MISNSHKLKLAIAILAIGLIAALSGCTSSAGSGNSNASTTNDTQPSPTAAIPVPTPAEAAVVNDTQPQPTEAAVTPTPAGGNDTPTLVSWFGSVTDSFGKPLGGVNVTLHLMTAEGEAYNLTTRSYPDMPYPGTYVIDNIVLTPDIKYAYAQATGDVGDGVLYYGRTDNFTLNKSRMSTGFIVMHVPMPDAIKLTSDDSIISKSGSTLITAQLYLNGKPYTRSGQTVNFTVGNDGAGKLQAAGNYTDEEGRTTVLLTGAGVGNLDVTAYMKIGISRNLTDTCTVQVTG